MEKYRLLFASDAAYPLGNTGFGIVSGQLIKGLLESGRFDIAHVARGLSGHVEHHEPYRLYVPPMNDPNGYHYIQYVCEMEKPHLIVFEADPMSITDWRKNVEVRRVPNLVHTPVEGAPLLAPWSDTLREILITGGWLTTYTEFGRQTIDRGVFNGQDDTEFGLNSKPLPRTEVLRLGLDHANFRPYPIEQREKIRKHLGWSNKFVVMNVARNAERKGWPRLLEAIALLKEAFPNLLLYAHTVPFENYFLRGHNLMLLAKEYGITDRMRFMGELRDPIHGIAFDAQPNDLTLIDMYNAADLLVAPTRGEGWNLPQCEAAACGLPVATTMYAGGWEVAENFAFGLPVFDYDTHTSGMRQANAHPQDIARAIVAMIEAPETRAQMRDNGIAVTSGYRWRPTVERFSEIAIGMCAHGAK